MMNGSVLGRTTERNASQGEPPNDRVISRWRRAVAWTPVNVVTTIGEEGRQEDDDSLRLDPEAEHQDDERDERDVRRGVQAREKPVQHVIDAAE